ncbi:MAG: nucleotidyltransferase family protein [Chloroflexi bacterium]|nr:nucleotidyltransferase family protein [Chloroflexota bacterium]
MISAIVLGAGLSQRMGTLKQLLPFGNHTVIEQVVSVLSTCTIDEIVVVLGHRHAEIAQVLSKWHVQVSLNPRYIDGMLASLQHGWRNVHPATNAVMHVLGDQPQLEPSVVEQLVTAYRAKNDGIFIPTFGGRRGHPILLDAQIRKEILALDQGATMRDVMRAHIDDIHTLSVNTDSILRDMDTWDDYQREIELRQQVMA